MKKIDFEWNSWKDSVNQDKHGVSFFSAQQAFLDPNGVTLEDLNHSDQENRFYFIGQIDEGILTVRFTYRNERVRIIGAGFWRAGKAIYEKKNKVH